MIQPKSEGYTFICEAGVVSGFGHLTRQSAIVEASPKGRIGLSSCVLDDDQQSLSYAIEIMGKDTKYLFTWDELRQINFGEGTVFVDGLNMDIDSLEWRNVELCAVMSPRMRIPRFWSACFFRGRKLPVNWIPKKGDVIELGSRYAVVPERVIQLRKNTKVEANIREESFIVTLMLGEMSDKHSWLVLTSILDELEKHEQLIIQVPQDKSKAFHKLWHSEKANPSRISTFSPADPWSQILNTNLLVTSGGQSLIESLCLGLPTISIPVHPEQMGFIDDMQIIGATLALADSEDFIRDVEEVIYKARDQASRLELSSNARTAIDGLGASRIHDVILENLK